MKKLMMAAAIVCAAVVAQAATVNWSSGDVYLASDAAGTTGSTKASNAAAKLVTMYIYEFADAASWATAQTKGADALYAEYVVGEKTPVGSKGTGFAGTASVSQTVTDSSGMHYAMALFVDKGNAAVLGKEAFVKASFATANIEGSGTSAVGNLITIAGGATSANWTAVPEPTSGLLLLLGVAGLALRRRRA